MIEDTAVNFVYISDPCPPNEVNVLRLNGTIWGAGSNLITHEMREKKVLMFSETK